MNCKPGDLAVIVSTGLSSWGHEHIGKVVLCVAINPGHQDCWFVKPELHDVFSVWDGCLRPLRDNDGTDETLTWAGKPEGVTA